MRYGAFYPVSEGIGSISGTFFLMGMEGKEDFHPVGLQPFQRPGKQCAFGIRLEQGQSLRDRRPGWEQRFYQKPIWGQVFLDLFGSRVPNELFPSERIAQIGERLGRSKQVTLAAVEAYCEEFGASCDTVIGQLKGLGIGVSKNPLFALPPRQMRQERMKVLKEGPFPVRSFLVA